MKKKRNPLMVIVVVSGLECVNDLTSYAGDSSLLVARVSHARQAVGQCTRLNAHQTMSTQVIEKDTAPPIMQDKKGHVQDLGRGSCLTSSLQSPIAPYAQLLGSDMGEAIGSGTQAASPTQQQIASVLTKTQRHNLRKKIAKQAALEKSGEASNQGMAGHGGTGTITYVKAQ